MNTDYSKNMNFITLSYYTVPPILSAENNLELKRFFCEDLTC